MKMLLQGSSIVLKVHVVHAGVTKSLHLELNVPIFSVCEHIRTVIREAEPENNREAKDYGLFLPHEMSKNGLWLDNSKNLAQYILKQGDVLHYRYKYRCLTIQSQDDIRKTLFVDDSWTISELMIAICAKMGILNHEEYSLIKQKPDESTGAGTSTSVSAVTKTNRKSPSKLFQSDKEQEKMDKMKRKLHTDDDLDWLNPSQTLRQQGIEDSEILLLQRKYFFSDMNIDTRDPIQLGLLFIQLKEAIINGKHPVSIDEAEKLAALQNQAEYGDYSLQKKKLPISLKCCIHKDYVKNKGIEKKILKMYEELRGIDNDEAKREYCALCRSLKTYGITFFLVKEHVKGKNKLIPRLLGVSRDRVVRLDEKTKEILKVWPLTSIKRWAGSYNAFTMDFGEYAPNEYYTAQTTKGEQISQLIAGYIDIIIRHKKAEEPKDSDMVEESSLAEMKIEPNQAEIVELRCNVSSKDEMVKIERDLHISMVSPTDELTHIMSTTDENNSNQDFTMVTPTVSDRDYTPTQHMNNISNSNKEYIRASLISGPSTEADAADYSSTPLRNTPIPTTPVNDVYRNYGSSTTTSIMAANKNQKFNTDQNNMLRARGDSQPRKGVNYSPDSFMTGGTHICHTVHRFNAAQKTLIAEIDRDLEKIDQNRQLLDVAMDAAKLGDKETRQSMKTISREHALHNLGNMNTEVVQVLRSSKHAPLNTMSTTSQNKSDSTMESHQRLRELERSFKVITVHFPSFVYNVRTIADISDDNDPNNKINFLDTGDGTGETVMSTINNTTADEITELKTEDTDAISTQQDNLVDAAKRLADAFSGMLHAVKPKEESHDLDMRKAILDAANKVGEASSELFRHITSPERQDEAVLSIDVSRRLRQSNRSRLGKLLHNSDHDYEDTLIYLVRAVANETAKLVQIIKQLTSKGESNELHKLIGPVTHAGLATSQLVICVKILAPTINQASCTNQVLAEIDDVKESITNVNRVFLDLIGLLKLNARDETADKLINCGLEDTVESVKEAITRLEEHLRCGISVINFAPRIQNLEAFIHSYHQMKSILVTVESTYTAPGGPQMPQHKSAESTKEDLVECLEFLFQISSRISEDINSLLDSDNSNKDQITILQAEKLFNNYQTRLFNLSQNLIVGPMETWHQFHYNLDNLLYSLLYEDGTRYIAHDQLIHNMYRSAQILLTTCHKLVMSFREISQTNEKDNILTELVDRSESVLLLMNRIKQDPDFELHIAQFIRETDKLVKSVVWFCNEINCDTLQSTLQTHKQDDSEILIEILINAINQALAQCEHVDSCLETVQPLRNHFEMCGVMDMLMDTRDSHLIMLSSNTSSPMRINIGQLIQISIAVLTKINSNAQETKLPHYYKLFELHSNTTDNNSQQFEPNLLISLYHNVCRIQQSIGASNQLDFVLKFKNVTALLYRLFMHADKILLAHGINPFEDYPLVKNVDELISTLSSLQMKPENIFSKFKSTILHNQNMFKIMLTSDSSVLVNQSTESLMSHESSIMSIKQFKEALDYCQQNFRSASFTEYMELLYQGYVNVTRFTRETFYQTHYPKIIDDYITFSLAILNLVQELENAIFIDRNDVLVDNRVESKTKLVCDSSSRLMQALTEAMKQSYGMFSEAILRLQEAKDRLNKRVQTNAPSLSWDKKSFNKIINENEMIETHCKILKEIIGERKPIAVDNQLFYISESLAEVCYTSYDKFRPFSNKVHLLQRLLDLGINLIKLSINIVKSQDIKESQEFDSVYKETCDTLDYLITCLREIIPGYKECCSGLATVAQLSHDLNETEFSIASENMNNKSNRTTSLIEEDNQKSSNQLYEMGLCVLKIHQTIIKDAAPDTFLADSINQMSNSLSDVVDCIVKTVNSATDKLSNEMKAILESSNELVESEDQYLQYLKSVFNTIETDEFRKTEEPAKNVLNKIILLLRLFDPAMSDDLLDLIKSAHNLVICPPTANQNLQLDEVANTVSGLITDDDDDTTILFASAGIRNCELKSKKFGITNSNNIQGTFTINGHQQQMLAPYTNSTSTNNDNNNNGDPDDPLNSAKFRDLIHKTATALLMDTKSLVQNSTSQQKSLAENTECVIKTISGFADEFEDRIVGQPRRESETKIMNSVKAVKSTMDGIYADNGTEVSRLTLSNSDSMLRNQVQFPKVTPPKHKSGRRSSFENSKTVIQTRLDKFSSSISNGSVTDNNVVSDPKPQIPTPVDIMERLVTHASSVLSLTSELMRMPLGKLLTNQSQGNNNQSVANNICSQCQDTLFEYLECLEELGNFYKSSPAIRNNILNLGKQVSDQFMKLFDLLQQIETEPENKYNNSLMLDIFYEIQDSIKYLLNFSSNLNESEGDRKIRKVSFRDKSESFSSERIVDVGKEISNNVDSLDGMKHKVNEFQEMLRDLKPSQHQSHSDKYTTTFRSLLNIIIEFTQKCTDLIGLSKQIQTTNHNMEQFDNEANTNEVVMHRLVHNINIISQLLHNIMIELDGQHNQSKMFVMFQKIENSILDIDIQTNLLLDTVGANQQFSLSSNWMTLLQDINDRMKMLKTELSNLIKSLDY